MRTATRLGRWLRGVAEYLSPVYGWWPTVLESFPGAWQQNVKIDRAAVEKNWAVFACVTLIAADISKMAAAVMRFSRKDQIWQPTFLRPILRKPNRYQTRIDFFRSWIFSLLLNGNAYVLKQRDDKGNVVAMYVLDPQRVTPLVSPDGGVYYQLNDDTLAQIDTQIVVPASEMIHDRMYTIWHPLIGVSPIVACGIAAMQGVAIQGNSQKFFQNMSRPSGILTAPGEISDETAARLKQQWETNFSGENIGRVAVVGDDLKYVPMTVNATDAQLIEQLKFTGEMICATFHVPPYRLGLGEMPTVNNLGALNQHYYDQALQPIVESMELRLDDGLELDEPTLQTWFDTSALLRMDPETRKKAHSDAIKGGWLSPNEARREEDLAPVVGGETPYLQQQNYSLAALAKRDAKEDPFGKAPSANAPALDSQPTVDEAQQAAEFAEAIVKGLKWAA